MSSLLAFSNNGDRCLDARLRESESVPRNQEVPMSSGIVAIVIVVAVVIIAGLVGSAVLTRRRKLQEQFGPEYDRVVAERSSRLRAEAELSNRQRRVHKLDIRPLTEEARGKYAADWVNIQERFVDSPEEAVADGYRLLTTVMTERGYPTGDDEQAQADLSVEHARTVADFRAAREISGNAASGNAKTEDLRQALIHYRALFTDLLGVPGTAGDDTHPAWRPIADQDSPADPSAGALETPASEQSDPVSNYGGMP
jgi:hypothetical protein